MPDIFISKELQNKKIAKKADRIKKLLVKEAKKSPESEKPKEKPQTSSMVSTRRDAAIKTSEALKHGSSKNVFAKIQAEINSILKDKPRNGFFSAFVGKPKEIKFETQDKDEKILALLRQHWVVNVPWIIGAIILIIFLPIVNQASLLKTLPSGYPLVIILGYFLLILYFVLERLLKWFYNVYIITDERIIDVDFYSLLYKNVSGAKIDKVQDVSYDMFGLVEAMFNYGTVHIQTAAEVPTFDFDNVPKPQQVVSLINQLIMEEELEKNEGRVR